VDDHHQRRVAKIIMGSVSSKTYTNNISHSTTKSSPSSTSSITNSNSSNNLTDSNSKTTVKNTANKRGNKRNLSADSGANGSAGVNTATGSQRESPCSSPPDNNYCDNGGNGSGEYLSQKSDENFLDDKENNNCYINNSSNSNNNLFDGNISGGGGNHLTHNRNTSNNSNGSKKSIDIKSSEDLQSSSSFNSKSNSNLSLHSNYSQIHNHHQQQQHVQQQHDHLIVCENCNHAKTIQLPIQSLSSDEINNNIVNITPTTQVDTTSTSTLTSTSTTTIATTTSSTPNNNIISIPTLEIETTTPITNNNLHKEFNNLTLNCNQDNNTSSSSNIVNNFNTLNNLLFNNNNNNNNNSCTKNTNNAFLSNSSPTIQTWNSNNQQQQQQANLLASSMGSTSELFKNSLISSFLNNQNLLNNNTNPFGNKQVINNSSSTTISTSSSSIFNNQNNNSNVNLSPRSNIISSGSSINNSHNNTHSTKDISYDARDSTFSINQYQANDLNSIISSVESTYRKLNESSSSNTIVKSNNNNHNNNNNNNNNNNIINHSLHSSSNNNSLASNESFNSTASTSYHHTSIRTSTNKTNHHHNDDYSKDITFLVSDHTDSIKEKSTVSNASSVTSASNMPRMHPALAPSVFARPRGRSISDSLFMSPFNKDSINDIQKAIENEKIKKTRFEELKLILGDREAIIDINDIQFDQKVGEGAFSEVWEGWWKGIHVAIKKLKIVGDESQFRERFIREVHNLKKGNHQNIVMFIGACYKPACIVTEFMAGGSLYSILHSSNNPTKVKYSFPLVLKMATDIALGFSHLHSMNIVHRDLTSQNILLDEFGNVKISDFGLSREKPTDGTMAMTNGGICNPRWRPPEITKNMGHYDEKVDVYCFSLVVWEILTGEIPYSELDGSQASAQVAYCGLRPNLPDTCDPELKLLLQQCWESEPSDRPDFSNIVARLKEISWNNPIGFISEQFSQYEGSTPRSAHDLNSNKSSSSFSSHNSPK